MPKKHQALYDALNAQVAAFQHRLARVTREPPLLRGAPLAALGCEHAADLGNEARWQAAVHELDALRRAGVQAIALETVLPLLSPGFHEPQPLLERYANLANEVRLRDMKLLVQHKALPPTRAMAQSGRYYQRLSKQRFLRERYEEAKSIVLALQPDYLTLVSDPREDAAGLKLSPRDWRGYLQRASTDLRRELGDFVPPLGAGLGLWGETSTLETFASVPGLAYIDLRFYPARAGNEDLLDRLLAWPDRVRAIDPGKRIVLSEAWLYKSSPVESFKGTPELNIVAREAFGFWSPLDVQVPASGRPGRAHQGCRGGSGGPAALLLRLPGFLRPGYLSRQPAPARRACDAARRLRDGAWRADRDGPRVRRNVATLGKHRISAVATRATRPRPRPPTHARSGDCLRDPLPTGPGAACAETSHPGQRTRPLRRRSPAIGA